MREFFELRVILCRLLGLHLRHHVPLKVSERTVLREWNLAQGLAYQEII
jgi:hypothetical protein